MPAFAVQELASDLSEEEADNLERVWIILLQSHLREFGYNMTFGGEGGHPTSETRRRLRLARLDPNIKDEEIISLYNAGLSVNAIGNQLGISHTTAHCRLRRAGIRLRPAGGVRGEGHYKYRNDVSNNEIARLVSLGFSSTEIGEQVGVTSHTVLNRLHRSRSRLPEPHHPRGKKHPCYRHDVRKDEIVRLSSLGVSPREIGEQLGVSKKTVRIRLRACSLA